jgi:fatty acid desaturase
LRKTLAIYQYVAPAVLAPLSLWLWLRAYHDLRLALAAWAVPIVWAYVVPGIGTNVLKVWEFDVRLRLGRFRPHHGFVFGSATATIAWALHGAPWYVLPAALFAINFAYDVVALRSGILHVYNQPWAEGKGAFAIALDYAPWFFGGFGAVYALGLGVMERFGVSWFFAVMAAALVLPAAAYVCASKVRYGHWGLGAPPSRRLDRRRLAAEASGRRPASRRDAGAPEPLNWLLLFASAIATAALLRVASHGAWYVAIAASLAFAFVNNVPFALMHEAVHGVAANTPKRNYVLGVLASCLFPTSFTLQQKAHLGHHLRNRTDSDLYDYYLPTQSRFARNVWLYGGNLLGLYWFCIPLSNILYLLATPLYRSRTFIERAAPKLGFGPHVRDIAELPPLRVWLEIAAAFGVQALLWWALDFRWQGWLLAHWLFAMHWSALQYVDHAWSARDVAGGAWDLRVPAPVRWLTLNYQLHRAHHTHPAAPWTELPSLAGGGPSFWQIYASLWRHGVQPAPPMGAPARTSLLVAFPRSGTRLDRTSAARLK